MENDEGIGPEPFAKGEGLKKQKSTGMELPKGMKRRKRKLTRKEKAAVKKGEATVMKKSVDETLSDIYTMLEKNPMLVNNDPRRSMSEAECVALVNKWKAEWEAEKSGKVESNATPDEMDEWEAMKNGK